MQLNSYARQPCKARYYVKADIANSCHVVICSALYSRALQEVLSETGQEVPGWLANIAARHAPYGTKTRRGGGRFGGRDFRKDFGGHNNYSHQRHGGYSGGAGGGYGGGGGGYGGGGYGGMAAV